MTTGNDSTQNDGLNDVEARMSTKDALPSFRDLVEPLVLYLGIPALTLYPIGAFILFLQILFHYYDGQHPVSAAYAVSLVPAPELAIKTAYTLVRDFVKNFLIMGFGAPVLLFCTLLFAKGWRFVWGTGWRRNPARWVWLLAFTVQGFLFLWSLVDIVGKLEGKDYGAFWSLIRNDFAIPVSVLAGYVIATDYHRAKRGNREPYTPELPGIGGEQKSSAPAWKWLWRGLMLLYLADILMLLFAAALFRSPNLPMVEFSSDSCKKGLLLGSDSARWHILEDEKCKEDQGKIVTIPYAEETVAVKGDSRRLAGEE